MPTRQQMQILEQIVLQAEQVDFGKFPRDFDVIMFGESHGDSAVTTNLVENIPAFKSLGINACGLEAPARFSRVFEKIFAACQSGQQYREPKGVRFGPLMSTSPKNANYRTLAHEMAKQNIRPFPFDPRPKNGCDFDIREKEQELAHIIKTNFERYRKSLILIGSLHIVNLGSTMLKDLCARYALKELGLRCTTVDYCGGESTSEHVFEYYDHLEKAARNVGRQNQTFILDNRGQKIFTVDFDYIIHLPQKN